MLERSAVFLRFSELIALCAAPIDNGEGCGKYSDDCRVDAASPGSFWSANALELLFRGVTSLREWLSQCIDVCDGVRCIAARASSECRVVPGVTGPTDAALPPLSLERSDAHARVAALLAPGPSTGVLDGLERVDLEVLSLILCPRSVVLMVCRSGRSGLGDRDGVA